MSKPHTQLIRWLIFGMLAAGFHLPVLAQNTAPTPTPTPASPEWQRLREEAILAEERARVAKAEQALAEAEKAALAARFPAPTSTPLKGETTIEGSLIETQMLAYAAVTRAADEIVARLKSVRDERGLTINKLAIYSEEEVKLQLSYKALLGQLELLTKAYEELLISRPSERQRKSVERMVSGGGVAFTMGRSLLGGLVDLTSFLRTDVKITGVAVDVAEATIVAELFRAAREKNGFGKSIKLYYPAMFSPQTEANVIEQSALWRALEAILYLKMRAELLIGDIETVEQKIAKNEEAQKNIKLSIAGLEKQINKTQAERDRLANVYGPNIPPEQRVRIARLEDEIWQAKKDIVEAEGQLDKLAAQKPGLEASKDEYRKRLDEERYKPDIDVAIQLLTEIKNELCKPSEAKAKLEEARTKLLRLKNYCKDKEKSIIDKLNTLLQSSTPCDVDAVLTELIALPSFCGDLPSVDDAIVKLKTLNKQADTLVTTLTKSDAGGMMSSLISYLKAESLHMLLDGEVKTADKAQAENKVKSGYWLQLKVIKAGGNNRLKTNLLWDIFTLGNRLSHSGGAVVQYYLFGTDGSEITSGVIPAYRDYIKGSQIQALETVKGIKKDD